jgi:hypothetical protein
MNEQRDEFGLTNEQFHAMAAAMGSAAIAGQALAAALRPRVAETIRAVNAWYADVAHLLPRQYRLTMMRKKLRKLRPR